MAAPILSWLTGGLIESAGKVATDVGKTFWGDRSAKDAAISAEQMATLQQYAGEFAVRPQRTWFDSFVDGLNRLVRPGLALGAQASFFWAAVDPVGFAETMRALALAPEGMWILWGGIWAFYFGGRILETAPKAWKVEPRTLEVAKEIAAERASRRKAEAAEKEVEAAERKAAAGKIDGPSADAAVEQSSPPPPPITPPDELSFPAIKDTSRAVRAVAATIWGEARDEAREGKIAVACVIRNRVNNPGWWGRSFSGVCTAKNQFSCWFDKQGEAVRGLAVSENIDDPKFKECLEIAEQVINGQIPDPTGGADHYYADYIAPPKWAVGREPTAVIGRHRFFKLGLGGRG